MSPRIFGAGGAVLSLALLALLSPFDLSAQGRLQVGTTRLEIGSSRSTTSMTLRNTGTAPVAAQVRVYLWNQSDGVDHLVPSDNVVVSPSIAEIAAGSEQLVRVIRLGPPATERDDSYRVIVDEIPTADGATAESGVNVRMRYLLPLFVRAPGASPAGLSCVLGVAEGRLKCENGGGRAARVSGTRLVGEEGEVVDLDGGGFGYVLPGTRKVWALPAGPPEINDRTLRLETRLDDQPTIVAVTLER